MTRGRNRNFQDPIGLVRRMLASNHPAARAALVREALRYPLIPLDMALSVFERRRVDRAADPGLPVVLIVGAPRSGSTLLGQVLTAHLPVSYPTNLTELFPRSPITATRRFGRLTRRHVAYRTYYGNTASLGSPNDAFSIWNRWLGDDRYWVPEVIPAPAGADMRAFFAAWHAAFERPFMNKNNRNTAAMAVLAAELPGVRFVIARRNPVFVAQSLLEAREMVQGDRRVGWGLGADPGPGGEDALADVVEQVHRVEQLTVRQLAIVEPGSVQEVRYEDLCADPAGVVRRVGEWLGLPATAAGLDPFTRADTRRLPPDEFDRLERAIEERFGSA